MTTKNPKPKLGELLRPTEVSRRLGVPLTTLADWRYRKKGPAYVRPNGKAIRYPENLLLSWVVQYLELGAA